MAHGLVAGFVGVFWGKIFNKKIIISVHNIYNFPNKGLYKSFAKWVFASADKTLGLSKQSVKEIIALGISNKRVENFTYWIDLEKFKKLQNVKRSLGWKDKFTVLFVGRLVEEKGVNELLESVKGWDKNIILRIIGSGPLEQKVKEVALKHKNVKFIGIIYQDSLPLYYSGSDVLIVPSVSEEGFGRVILESLACNTPVIAARRGAISEAMDETVGRFINISPRAIKNEVEYLFAHPDELRNLAKNTRKFAERRYSEKNVEKIIRSYQS